MAITDPVLAGLLGQLGQRGNDPRRSAAARLMQPQAPTGPLPNSASVLAHALTQGLNAYAGKNMMRDAEEAETARQNSIFERATARQRQMTDEADTAWRGLTGQGGAPMVVPPQPTQPAEPQPGAIRAEPLAPPDLMPHIEAASAESGIPVPVLTALIRQESNFNPNATGRAGEIGLAQIMPSTARQPGFGVQPVDPEALRDPGANVRFGARYLAARAPQGTNWNDPASRAAALARYNGGGDPNYVQNVERWMPGGGGQGAIGQNPAQPGATPPPGGAAPQPSMEAIMQGLQHPNPLVQQRAQAALQVMQAQRQMQGTPQTVQTAEGVFILNRDGTLGQRLGGRPTAAGEGPPGPFRGTGMDAQASNIVLAPDADPASPTYAAAYQHLYGPRLQTQPDGTTIVTQPQPPQGVRPPAAGFGTAPVRPDAEPAPLRPTVTQDTPAGSVTRIPGRGAPLSDTTARQLSDLSRTANEWRGLMDTFKPDFAGFGSDFLGNATNAVARNTPGASPRADWWQRYNLLANIERNELFGSALTARELEAWRAAMIGPGMNPEQVRLNMTRQAELARTALMRRAQAQVANGGNIEAIAAATGLPVEDLMRGATGAAPPPPDAAAPRRVRSPAEAEALPPGTVYETPDGRRFTR